MEYGLPESLRVCGTDYPIRSDWRAVLDILTALNDPDMTEYDKTEILLGILYADEIPPDRNEAMKQAAWFIDGGQEQAAKKTPMKLMDWEQDFPLIISAVNQIAGKEVREEPNIHWWTFLAWYTAIGDCAFANVVSIRKKLKKGKKLEPYEKEFYRNNRETVDFKTRYTESEREFLKHLTGR